MHCKVAWSLPWTPDDIGSCCKISFEIFIIEALFTRDQIQVGSDTLDPIYFVRGVYKGLDPFGFINS